MNREEVEKYYAKWGYNELNLPSSKAGKFVEFIKKFADLYILLLLISACLSLIMYIIKTKDAAPLFLSLILFAVCTLNASMDYLQEYKTSNILRKILKEAPSISTVIRCGVVQGIPSKDLIIGDVVILRAGDRIPCDLRLFYAKDLFVNNSSITGEGEGQERFPYPTTNTDSDIKPLFIEAKNIAFGGTLVIEGEGYGIVIRRGRDSVMGEIALMTIVEKPPKSQMKIEIENFVRVIVVTAFVTVAIFFVQSLIRGYDIEIIFSFCIGIFVSYIPQGLPLTMSTLLTIAAKRMAKRNVLVKNLQAVETLGSITLLATDKTGTLTQNKMNVISCWMNGMFYEVPSHLFDKSDDRHNAPITTDTIFVKEQQQPPPLPLFKEQEEILTHPNILTAETPHLFSLLQVCSLCSRAKINTEIPSSEEDKDIVGDATEIGLVKFSMKMLPSLEFPITKLTDWQDRWEKVYEIPFNSLTKWHLTVHYIPKEDRKMANMHSSSSYRVFIKGAPERISKFCKKILYSPSSQWGKDLRDWTPAMDEKLQEAYEHFASSGKRVLALATMDLPSSRYWEGFLFTKQSIGPELQNDSLDNFVFLGILAIMDPPKHGVKKTIKCCRAAGIQLVMITGDHALTAEAIGRQVGLISGDSTSNDSKSSMIIINGEELSHFTKMDWKEVLQKEEVIFARTSPQQKLEIVTKFQQKGHIVGVSGDGINDGPALKKADLGISMNKMASDIAKDAAAMILLDDNFTSIIHGISEGRLIFENLQKCIRYVTSHTIPEVVAFVLFISLGIPTPLNVFYALLIDLGSELLPGLSFAFEPPEGNLMLIGPRKIIIIDDDDYDEYNDEEDNGFVVLNDGIAVKFENISLGNERCSCSGSGGGDIESQSRTHKKRKKKGVFTKNYKGKVLVDSSMIIWSYLQVGIIQSLGCIGAYLITFSWYDIPFSSLISSNQTYFKADSPPFPVGDGTTTTFLSAEEQVRIVKEAVASYYWSIVIFQQFNLWICKHHFTYPYGKDMLRNRITYIGAVGALVIATMVVWVPGLNDALGGSPPPWAAFISPITAGLFLFLYEFIRRYLHIHHHIGNDPDINNTSLKDFIRTTTNTVVKE